MTQQNYPYDKANWFSKLTFCWVTNFIYNLEKDWEFKNNDDFFISITQNIFNRYSRFKGIFQKSSNFTSFMGRLTRVKRFYFLIAFIYCIFTVINVYFMFLLTEYLQECQQMIIQPDFKKVALIFLILIFGQFIPKIFQNYTEYLIAAQMVMMKNELILIVINSSIHLQQDSYENELRKNLINIIEEECQIFQQNGFLIVYFIQTFFTMFTTFILAIYLIGYPFLIYLLVSIICMSINYCFYSGMMKSQQKLLKMRDKRIQNQRTIFQNISFVKSNVLEAFFTKKIYDYRNKELSIFKTIQRYLSLVFFMNWIAPKLAISALYMTYFYFSPFLLLGTFISFERLQSTLTEIFVILPWSIRILSQFIETFKKIKGFTNICLTYVNYLEPQTDLRNDVAIELINGNFEHKNELIFNWLQQFNLRKEEYNSNQFKLKNINLKIMQGEVIFFLGKINSGKSSILKALIGAMYVQDDEKTELIINGKISYLQQNNFFIEGTLEENILFFSEKDDEKLKQIIDDCDLQKDLEKFSQGIKEQYNDIKSMLTRTQKLKLNLARCLYKDYDILILDKPFSDLPYSNARKILKNLLKKKQKNKTILISSNNVQYAKKADRIYFIEKGTIKYQGKPEEFLQQDFFLKFQFIYSVHKVLRDKNMPINHYQHKKELQKFKKQVEHILYVKESSDIDDSLKEKKYKIILNMIAKYYGGIPTIIILLILCIIPYFIYYKGILYLYNYILYTRKNDKVQWETIYNYALLILTPNVSILIRMIFISFLHKKFIKKLHNKMMITSTHSDMLSVLDSIPVGRVVNKFQKDLSNIEDNIVYNLNDSLVYLSILIVDVFIIVSSLTWFLIFFFFIYFLALKYFQNIYIRVLQNSTNETAKAKARSQNLARNIIYSRQFLKIYNLKKKLFKKFIDLLNRETHQTIQDQAITSWFTSIQIAFNIFFVQVFFYIFFIYLLLTNYDTKILIIALNYLLMLLTDVQSFINAVSRLEIQIESWDQCEKQIQMPVEKNYFTFDDDMDALKQNMDKRKISKFSYLDQDDDEQKIQKYKQPYEKIQDIKYKNRLFPLGEIEFYNVDIYIKKYNINFKDFNFQIQSQQKVALFGEYRSGARQILQMIVNQIRPQKGNIIIDKKQIDKINLKLLRKQILFIDYRCVFNEGTILQFFEPRSIEKRILNQIQIIMNDKDKLKEQLLDTNQQEQQVEQELLKMNQKYQNEKEKQLIEKLIEFGFDEDKLNYSLMSHIDDDGENLDQLEKDLLNVFRVFYSNQTIILIDFLRFSFEQSLERELIEFIQEKINQKTLIIASDNFQAIKNFDKIVFLKDGKITEQGLVNDLIKDQNSQYNFYMNQVEDESDSDKKILSIKILIIYEKFIMKIELILHRLKAQLNTQIRVFRFRLFLESNKLFQQFQVLYDSNYIKNDNKQDYHVISQFLNIEPQTLDYLLKFEIDYLQENADKRDWIKFENFVFIEDLLKQEKIIIFKINDHAEIKLNYDIKGQIQNTLNQYQRLPDFISPEEDPGIIQLTKTSNLYIEAIIPFRRFQVAIFNFLSTKHYILEFSLYLSSIIFIFKPYMSCLFLFLIAFFTHTKFLLRIKLIQSSIQFFETNEGKIEQTKKNLNFINLISNLVIGLCEKLDKIFIQQDRKFYYQFIKILKWIVIGIIIFILFVPIKIIILLTITLVYILRNFSEVKYGIKFLKPIFNFKYKNKQQEQQYFPSKSLRSSCISNISQDNQFERLSSILPRKYFYYENQQWYVGVGFKGTPLSRANFTDETGKIKIDPQKIEPDIGYKWKNDWTIVMNQDTDQKGWQYAKTFEGPYRSSAKAFYIVRRRMWERVAEKEKLTQRQLIIIYNEQKFDRLKII